MCTSNDMYLTKHGKTHTDAVLQMYHNIETVHRFQAAANRGAPPKRHNNVVSLQ